MCTMDNVNVSGWNLLIADDEPDSRGIVTYVLSFHNIPFRTADDGLICLDLLRAERPTALLLDLQMPKLNGWDLIKQLRADATYKDLTVIALTANAMTGDRERILAEGFDGYLAKPISVISLIDDIDKILKTKNSARP
jgi:CheY-like chemotaxis protein